MKRIMFAALVVFLVATAAAHAAERPTFRKALEAKQVDLWENVTKRQMPKPIPQWCDHSCSTWCMYEWDECHVNCYGPQEYCDATCYQIYRNCLCVNACCQPPHYQPGGDPCEAP